jgi:predicted 2-oxoglutarate/Fe(II)-dependent dioxygenase YbiX
MIRVIKNVLTPEQCSDIIEFCTTVDLSGEIETFIGNTYGRHFINPRGGFNVYRMSRDESLKYCRQIESAIPGTTVISFRPMCYETGAYLRNHLDASSNPEEGDSDHSLNIMLSAENEFTGGQFIIGNESRQIIELEQGDAIMYDYSLFHEVKKIKTGNRWIINVRVKHD